MSDDLTYEERNLIERHRREKAEQDALAERVWRGYQLDLDLQAYREWKSSNPSRNPVDPTSAKAPPPF